MDDSGWVDAYGLVSDLEETYSFASADALAAVVSTDEKGRFEVSGNKIRAAYGHSDGLGVTVSSESDDDLPDILFHGTSAEKEAVIMEEGLQPMSRQAVHLTDSVNEARDVGSRHSNDVVVFEIDVDDLLDAGFEIGTPGDSVYTISEVPPAFLTRYK